MSADLIHGYKLCSIATQVAKKWKTWQNLNSVLQISAKKNHHFNSFYWFYSTLLTGRTTIVFLTSFMVFFDQ